MPENFDPAGLGVWTGAVRHTVTRDAVIGYAKATNDPIEAHLAGDVAPPVYAIVPVFPSLMEPALEVVPLRLLGRILHGEQDFVFHRPIRPGDELVARGRMTGWKGGQSGTAACVYLETRDTDGELVNEQRVTFFVRGFDTGDRRGELAPEHVFDESLRRRAPVATVTQHIDDDQPLRYGPAAGDPMPIHLDEDVARAAGLPGIIAHGLCTMAFTSWALLTELAGSDVRRLRRLAVRFAKPVLPGQDITTTVWRRDATTYAFETTAGDDVVVKDGLAEIRE
ncbi:MaoC family dehydratase N-terminal domain-containing protein [Amycolatopsis thermalba]|uniref:MaoC family dehydratase N-terminal domain-containing protein n=1 Tax=Amycolatopsis thermalba TaxID=944492 RepID=A0ABY4NZ82_9PSEU|nr:MULTISPECIES: MaoC/PaaZ C-terminal domain-containing protein [Amycolatopsis]UQS25406.1 MaoC family dehydratase N-terminal domain-containing protein [Amycolatopsis thermalba]